MKLRRLIFTIISIFAVSCHSSSTEEETATEVGPKTPVTVTTISNGQLEDFVELNATSSFLEKNYLKASINGYIQKSTAQKGKFVSTGQVIFSLITREARAIGNTINKLDPDFKFSGISNVRASKSGYITELGHQIGDYVQEGEQLAVISNSTSLVFLLDMPYELNASIRNTRTILLTLPDGEKLYGTVSSSLPQLDSVAQTQRIIIKVNPGHAIPENLIAKARIVKNRSYNTSALPKAAILSNETQDEFWVMKLLNDSTALKVRVKKGIETADKIEIQSPQFKPSDRIILTGNYGLADTAKISIVKN